MSDPQLQYNNIIHVLVFRWRNDWLVGLQPFFFFFFFFLFFFFFFVEGQNNAECQCEENDRNIQIQEPRLRPEKFLYWYYILRNFGSVGRFFFLFFCLVCFVLFCFVLFFLM